MSSREDTPEPGASAASTSQAAPAAPPDDSQENAACPECRGISTACSSSCRHCFCQLCLWDWNLGEAACPRCRRPTRHPYPQHVALYHEVQDRVYDGKRRRRGRSARQPRSCSGRCGPCRPRERRRRRRRSLGWSRCGCWRSQHTRGSDSPRRRWRQQERRAWQDVPEEGRTPRFERAIPTSSPGNRSRHVSHRSWSQQDRSRGRRRWSRGREGSHGWDRRQSRSSRGDQDTQRGSHSARQRRWRSCDADSRRAPRPQCDIPSEGGETHPWEDSDSSRQQHTGRQTRGRSHRRGQNSQPASRGTVPHNHSTRQRQRGSWDADQGRAPRSQRDTSGSSGRSRHRRRSWSRARRRDT